MRATVKEVATFFPTAIISGRARPKVSLPYYLLLTLFRQIKFHILTSYSLIEWQHIFHSRSTLYLRLWSENQVLRNVVLFQTHELQMAVFSFRNSVLAVGLWICTTSRAVLCRESWYGYHGSCWWHKWVQGTRDPSQRQDGTVFSSSAPRCPRWPLLLGDPA